ncbi:sugar ABC transporter substrate-binding protein [Mariluticola halotolerans]|uniref:sugar ABC transporter substrate-binding protein n=1 Tax=Mariluticola halotolerans TaxID=2909283 RepID=UPI0026E3D70D|nr:sugar ABC transporter substrate-binding protein [Mariluticola halotolerans]UJQ95018.1 sugar ABC transporter substrate-binding protein [Mariluticola halotolerans]
MKLKPVLLVSAAALLASVSWAQAKTVCYVTAADSHAYATPANQALQARADELGIDILSLSQDFDVQKGTEQLNTCIARKVDGIILWPLDPQAYIPGLARAQAANIPAILINSPMGDQAQQFIVSFTGPDVYAEGEMAADALNEALGGEGSIVVIAGQAGNGTTIGRVGGFEDRLAEIGSGIEILDTVNADFDQQKALVASRDLITRFGDGIKGVYSNDDTMARGFIDAWKEAYPDTQTPPIVGINGQKDAFESIRSGEMYATIVQSPVEDGKVAMNTMAEILDGTEVDARVPIPLTVVTLDNVETVEPAF